MGSTSSVRRERTNRGLWMTTAAVAVALAVVLALGDGRGRTRQPGTTMAPTHGAAASPPTSRPTQAPLPTFAGELSLTTRLIRAPILNRIGASGVWTGSEVIVWGGWTEGEFGVLPARANGAAFDPGTNGWRRIRSAPIAGRARHIAAWTGEEMLVWGGYPRHGLPRAVGAAYDPVRDRWRTLPPAPISWSSDTDGAWTGREWVIGRKGRLDRIQLAAYDPARDRWRRLPDPGIVFNSETHLAWCAETLLVGSWTEGLFRLDGDRWAALARLPDGKPVTATPICAGDRVVVALDGLPARLIAEWDPATDTWCLLPPPPVGAPADVRWWSKDHSTLIGPTTAFDMTTGTWSRVTPEMDRGRDDAAWVWTGTEVVLWGGWYGVTGRPLETGIVMTPSW